MRLRDLPWARGRGGFRLPVDFHRQELPERLHAVEHAGRRGCSDRHRVRRDLEPVPLGPQAFLRRIKAERYVWTVWIGARADSEVPTGRGPEHRRQLPARASEWRRRSRSRSRRPV